ncbi:energy-coupling factor ABC transporter ATP-binding protein [Micrococcus terreus]|uniref:Biotin transport system ATP-binding protein n=1 Tax=Micrococcus terreus TaxID=574650 RepID=A0A1I7MLV7_9MICC|nr:ABC transporter ATP-binding protein [Micrococcus terreus]SFV22915.1 biotin transport system ATP-binding protein [Micrococcus terreus]
MISDRLPAASAGSITFRQVGVEVPTTSPGQEQRPGSQPGTVRILEGLDLELTEARVCVIGANGSGKSTLIRLLNGLVSGSTGQVSVHGLDPAVQTAEVRAQTGFVFTNPLVQLVMPTAGEDVELSLRRTHARRAQRRSAAADLLTEFGLGGLADRSVYDLSGGQRQRLALATVLATDPVLLVADEPTTLLDLAWTLDVQQLLLSRPGIGRCRQLVYTTHDLEFAALADRCLVMDRGRVVHDAAGPDAVRWYRELVHSRRTGQD